MSLTYSKTAYQSGSSIIAEKRVTLTSDTINPDCIAYALSPRAGDVITYGGVCARLVDSAPGTFTLDSEGVPTITGSNGDFGVEYGTYACPFEFNGYSFTINVSHFDDAAIRALYSFPPQDADGFSTFETGPISTDRLIYLDPTNGLDGTAVTYTWGSPPTGGWEDPSSVNAYQNYDTAFALLRDGTGDRLLIKRGETVVPTADINFEGLNGASTDRRIMFMPYGDAATARPILNPATDYGGSSFIMSIVSQNNIAVIGIDFYPEYRDPTSGSFAGWDASMDQNGLRVTFTSSGILVEDCRFRYCQRGMNIQTAGATNLSDVIVRRNVFEWNYSTTKRTQAMFTGSDTEGVTFEHYIGENVFDHCGWYKQSISLTATGNSGNTTSLTDTGAFAGLDLVGVGVQDTTNGGVAYITSHNDDTVNFSVTANVDFTSAQAYKIGATIGNVAGKDWQFAGGMAELGSHNTYTNQLQNSIDEKNIYLRGASGSNKITSTSFAGEQHPFRDFIQKQNVLFNNELGLGGGGNTVTGDTRFQDIRCMDNVDIGSGSDNPTNRGLKWGFGATDWNRGCMENNIIGRFGTSGVENVRGITIGGVNKNTRIAGNTVFNIGKATGAKFADAGCLVFNSDASPVDFTNVHIVSNDFQQKDTDGAVVGNWLEAENGNVTFTGNHYHASAGDTDTYYRDDAASTYTLYQTATGETSATNSEKFYMDEGISLSNYQIERGGTAGDAGYITDQVARRKGNWDKTLQAEYFVAYAKKCLSTRPDVKMEVKYFTLTSTGHPTTQSVSLSSGFGVPKGVIFVMSANKFGTPGNYANSSLSVGFDDGTNRLCTHTQFDSEATPGQSNLRAISQVYSLYRSQGGANYEAYITSFDTDGFTLQIDLTGSEAFECMAIAITGDDVDSFIVNSLDDLGTGTSLIEINDSTALDLFFAMSCHSDIFHTSGGTFQSGDCDWSLGMAEAGGGQGCMNWFARNFTGSPSENTAGIYNDAILAKCANGATETFSVALNSFSKVGVHITPDASTSNSIMAYCGVKFKYRPKISILDTAFPTSGTVAIAPGFQPNFGLWLQMGGPTAYNAPLDADTQLGITAFDETTTFTVHTMAQDNVTLTDTSCIARSDSAVSFLQTDDTQTVDVQTSATNLDSDGVTFTTSNYPAAEIKGKILLIAGVN